MLHDNSTAATKSRRCFFMDRKSFVRLLRQAPKLQLVLLANKYRKDIWELVILHIDKKRNREYNIKVC